MSDRPGSALAARLTDPDLYRTDPHPLFARLREESPVAWNAERGFWALTRHAEVSAVSVDHERFCSRHGVLVDEIGAGYETPPTMMHTDPPAHSRYRQLVQPAFRPTVVRSLEPLVRARSRALVDALPAGQAVDVVDALAAPFPLMVISELLGLPESEWRRCYEWSEAVIPGATDWPEERRAALMADMFAYLLEAAAARRADPGEDVLSMLATATIDGDALTGDELTMFLVQLLVAGNETTRNLLSAGLVALAERPAHWTRLRADRSLVGAAVDELLRWTSPVIGFMRTATADVELAGVAVTAGDPVLLLYASANRDPAAFGPTAGELDLARSPNPHLAFGFGPHFCLGAALARLEGRAALDALLDRFSTLAPAGEVERTPSMVLAGVRRAELRFDP